MATLVTGTTLLFIRQGRLANYDTHLMAWTALSIAAGLWAIRPLKPINWVGRRVTGWVICGVALGGGIMSKNPLAVVYVAAPLLVTLIVAPRRRLGNALGLVFALLLGGLIAAPWYLYVMEHVPEASREFATEYTATRAESQPIYNYAAIFIVIFPWTVYLLGALFQPFIRARGEHRRRILLGWLWFVSLLVLLSIHPTKQLRYLVPLLPAIGVMVGQLWSYHAALADEGLKDPGVNLLRIPHWLMLAIGAVGLPAFVLFQPAMIAFYNRSVAWVNRAIGSGLDPLPGDRLELPGLAWPAAAGLGGVLIAATVLGAIWHWRWRPGRAFAASVVWALAAMSVVQFSYARSYHATFAPRADAERLAAIVADRPVYYLYDRRQDRYDPRTPTRFEPEEQFLFYLGARVLPVSIDPPDPDAPTLQKLAGQPCYIMLRLDEHQTNAGRLEGFGFQPAGFEFTDGRNVKGFDRSRLRLYRSPHAP
jgi:4-amino-4-deoxy-L-arabinose transferase-like glycosyltransferase